MSMLDEIFRSILLYAEQRAMDFDLARIPSSSRRVIWSARIRQLRLRLEN